MLHAAIVFTAVSFAMLYAADALSVTTGIVVVLMAAFVYTLGEMTAGPVVSALSAETPPPDQRGRYMAATQLAWGAAAAVSPLLYSRLLDRGSLAAWGGPIVICAVWAVLVEVLTHRMPQVSRPVTNVAEPEPGPLSRGRWARRRRRPRRREFLRAPGKRAGARSTYPETDGWPGGATSVALG